MSVWCVGVKEGGRGIKAQDWLVVCERYAPCPALGQAWEEQSSPGQQSFEDA